VVAAHFNSVVTLVSIVRQHAPLCRSRLLLLLIIALILARDAVISMWSDDVVVQQLTVGDELATIGVVPGAP